MNWGTIATWMFFIIFVGLLLKNGDVTAKLFTTGSNFVLAETTNLQGTTTRGG